MNHYYECILITDYYLKIHIISGSCKIILRLSVNNRRILNFYMESMLVYLGSTCR